MEKRIIIIGAGPTGLGAGFRLKELGYENWAIIEKESYIGGLSASLKDDKGFIWDKGGHVLFSHYKYFDNIVKRLLGNDYIDHERKAYIYSMDKWIPYPFQNNIRYLPKDAILECLCGLIDAQKKPQTSRNFKEWILNTFGQGIAKYFMIPQNLKTWGYPLEDMSKDWISDRISVVDVERILKNIIYAKDDVSWGPNSKFKFPLYGGTGGLFKRLEPLLKKNLHLKRKIINVNTDKRKILLEDGSKKNYDILINTSPLDQFIKMMKPCRKELLAKASLLKYSSTFIVGVGLKGKCMSSKCWMYFPEDKIPFYRSTYFSNYSKNNVPNHDLHWSLMCETAYSEYKRVDKRKVIEKTINGLIEAKLISKNDKKNIVSAHLIDIEYAYPIPTIDCNKALQLINSFLEKNEIYSRGRFGAWKYEVGNMDHSFMQGIEVVDRIVSNKNETTYNSK